MTETALQVSPDTLIQTLIFDKYIQKLPDKEICSKHGFSRNTLYTHLRKPEALEIRYNVVPRYYKKELALEMADKAKLTLNAITKEKADKAGISALSVAAGIMIDKFQLLTGQATQISAHLHVKIEDIKLADLLGGL